MTAPLILPDEPEPDVPDVRTDPVPDQGEDSGDITDTNPDMKE